MVGVEGDGAVRARFDLDEQHAGEHGCAGLGLRAARDDQRPGPGVFVVEGELLLPVFGVEGRGGGGGGGGQEGDRHLRAVGQRQGDAVTAGEAQGP
jgi:hypothetical protein